MMNQECVNENKKRFAIVISFLILMICITSSTYAYYALTASDNNNVVGSVGVDGGLDVNVTKLFPESTSRMIPQLESSLGTAISEEYSCIDGNGNVVCQVYEASVTNGGNKVNLNGYIKFNFSSGSNMPNLKWKRIDNARSIGEYTSSKASVEDTLFVESDEFASTATKTYYFVIWIDEIGAAQYDTGSFSATIKFNTVGGGLTSTIDGNNDGGSDNSTFAQHIIDLYNTGEESDYTTVNIGGDSSHQEVTLNTKQRIMMVEQGTINGVDYGVEYRYYGNDTVEDTVNDKYLTKNYVDFNGELWRIISVSKVFSSEEDTTGETRVRIIKDKKIGDLAWDNDDYSNNWADATLMCQLNTIYYNDTVPACTGKSLTSLTTSLNAEARSLIDNALWYLGGNNTSDLYADDYYNMERNNAGYGSNPTRWTGKIGIMYPSDYAYAADLGKCTKTGYNYIDWDSGELDPSCAGTDWLFSMNSQWLISPNFDDLSFVWRVLETGYVFHDVGYVVLEFGVRPLAVLKSGVTKLEGEGTSGNPYKLGLGA